MEAAEINKPVSSHTARHTFATINTFSGIRIEVISKILGHTNLKTTMIYAKIMADVKVEEMKLWGSTIKLVAKSKEFNKLQINQVHSPLDKD